MNLEEILEVLKRTVNKTPNVSFEEFNRRIEDITNKEHEAFAKEDEKLRMRDEQFNRRFDI